MSLTPVRGEPGLVGGDEPAAPRRPQHPLVAAAPEFFGAAMFLFAFVAPLAWRNIDLIYVATVILWLEFIAVHAGVFTQLVRERASPEARAGVAIALGIFYAIFCLGFGFVAGTLWPALVVTAIIFGRFLAAVRSDEPLGGDYLVRAMFTACGFMVLMALAQALPIGASDSVLDTVRAMERARGISSTFDPMRSVLFLVLWYTAQGAMNWWRAAATTQARQQAGAGGLQIDTYPGYLEVLHVQPNYYRAFCFVAGLVGVGIALAYLSHPDPLAKLILGVVGLTGALFLFGAWKQSWTRRWVMHVMPGRISASEEGRELAYSQELTNVDEIAARLPKGRLTGWAVVARQGSQELEVDRGLPRPDANALARLMILYYKFGDQPEALRVAIGREPEVQALLDEHELRQLKVKIAN